jgi:arylsulfatase A-like enzyme
MKLVWALALAFLLVSCGEDDTSAPTATTAAPKAVAVAGKAQVAPAVTTVAGGPRHIVMFIVDDLAINDANFMQVGKTRKYTPTIDALAAQSTVLTNYHAVTAICTASRYTMMTGNYPSRATNKDFVQRLQTEGSAVPEFNTLMTKADMTLPRRLKALGYRTGFVGKDHMSDITYESIQAGSHLTDPNVAKKLDKDLHLATQGLKDDGFDEAYSIFPTNVTDWPVVELQAHNLDWIADGALKFIDANKDKNFFLVVSLTVPHYPWAPAQAWNADPRITPFGMLATAPNVMPARSTIPTRLKAAGYPLGLPGPAGFENFLWLDDAVAAVLNRLKQYNLMDTTAIMLEGDHGFAAKGTIYVGGSWTPALWYYGGKTGRNAQLASTLDFQNTVLAMAGAAPAGDGVSLLPLLQGQTTPVRQNLYMELGYARAVLEGDWEYIAIRHSQFIKDRAASKGFLLTPWVQWTGPHSLDLEMMPNFPAYLATDQLYNIKADPLQKNNLYGQPEYQAIVDNLRAKLQAQASKTPGAFPVY